MLTDKELIEAQEQDIRNLLAQLRLKDEEIDKVKQEHANYGTNFKFDTPYFRLDSYYVSCYRLVNVVIYKWNKSATAPGIDTRFSEVYAIRLSDLYEQHGTGGNRVLKTCISYDELMRKLERRVKIATNKNDLESRNKYLKLIAKVQAKTSECTSFFDMKEGN